MVVCEVTIHFLIKSIRMMAEVIECNRLGCYLNNCMFSNFVSTHYMYQALTLRSCIEAV
jgi:hypothetical protein